MPSTPHRSKAAVLCCAALALSALAAAPRNDAAYRASIEKWRAQRVVNLKADGGWLSVAGLFWLHEGDNRFGSDPTNDIVLPASAPAQAGNFEFHGGKTTLRANQGVRMMLGGRSVETAALRADVDSAFDPKTDQITLGDSLTLLIHGSGNRFAVRLFDKNSAIKRRFTNLRWFPVDPAYRLVAQYTPYDKPKTIEVQNIMGDFTPTPIPGYLAFHLGEQDLRLEVESNAPDPGFSITFRDLTCGKETYPAARFVETDDPKDGKVVLDFNKAHNPPCAYNPYTTCPLPTPENRLRARVAAGEMNYLGPH
jgi:uncharacterized protein (DUF1684 family)